MINIIYTMYVSNSNQMSIMPTVIQCDISFRNRLKTVQLKRRETRIMLNNNDLRSPQENFPQQPRLKKAQTSRRTSHSHKILSEGVEQKSCSLGRLKQSQMRKTRLIVQTLDQFIQLKQYTQQRKEVQRERNIPPSRESAFATVETRVRKTIPRQSFRTVPEFIKRGLETYALFSKSQDKDENVEEKKEQRENAVQIVQNKTKENIQDNQDLKTEKIKLFSKAPLPKMQTIRPSTIADKPRKCIKKSKIKIFVQEYEQEICGWDDNH